MTSKRLSQLMLLRLKAGLTQAELANLLGVSVATVKNWERGRSTPQLTIPQFKTLLRVLNITVDELPDDFGSVPSDRPDGGED